MLDLHQGLGTCTVHLTAMTAMLSVESMATITIRNLDEETKGRLKIRAATLGHSMEQEARNILRESLSNQKQGTEDEPAGFPKWRGRWKERMSTNQVLEITRES